jgi:hypothetical protein
MQQSSAEKSENFHNSMENTEKSVIVENSIWDPLLEGTTRYKKLWLLGDRESLRIISFSFLDRTVLEDILPIGIEVVGVCISKNSPVPADDYLVAVADTETNLIQFQVRTQKFSKIC